MIHLFFGENSFEIERRLAELLASYEGDIEKVDGSVLAAEQLPDLFAGVTLFSTKRLVVIKQVSQNKSLWPILVDWLEKGIDNDLVFVETNLDKRTKTYKWLEKHAQVIQTKELQPYEAVRWVMDAAKDLQVSHELAEFFVDYVGTDQWRLSSELEKLRLAGEVPSRQLIEQLVEPTPQATAFELLDAAFRAQNERFSGLFETVSRNDDPYLFFGLLAGQVYALALVRTARGKRPDEIARETGVHPFVLQKVSGLADTLSTTDLKLMVERLAELDAHMKSRAVEPWTQIRSFLTSLVL